MRSKRIVGLSLGILGVFILAVIGWTIYSFRGRIKVDAFRQTVFCEQISTGMLLSDVRKVLSQYGEFRETEAQFQGGLHAIGIYFTNSKARNLFGETSIVLIFENEMYVDARVPVPLADSYRSLCNK